MGRQFKVERTTRASGTSVCGILHHHPETAVSAILALSYPVTHSQGNHVSQLAVGRVTRVAPDVSRVALQWDLSNGTSTPRGFVGELVVASLDDGAHLTLAGVLRGDEGDEVALERVLGWLASAASAGVTSADRR